MPWLEARPDPLPGMLGWYLEAFWELNRDRTLTMGGPGTIPGAVIREFIREERVHEPEMFKRLMWALDTKYLNYYREQRDRAKND